MNALRLLLFMVVCSLMIIVVGITVFSDTRGSRGRCIVQSRPSDF